MIQKVHWVHKDSTQNNFEQRTKLKQHCEPSIYPTVLSLRKELRQVSRMTSILEVERSLNSCMLVVQRPLAYFRSANLKTFYKYAKSIRKMLIALLKKMGNGCNNNK